MTTLKISNGDWVIICDGRKALVTTNAGDAEYINLRVLEEHESKSPATHELGADKPGRVQQSMGGGGTAGHGGSHSGVRQTDWHEEAERTFLSTVADRLNRAVAAGEARRVVIAAPPRALGALRPMLSKQTDAAIIAALDKDYVNLPINEIEKRLKKPH
jgi:protein required for attachment to host cells